MKDLRPKIKKVLIDTLKNYYAFGDYTVYEKDNEIRVKDNEASALSIKRGWDDEVVAFVPEYDHEEAFCFTCDGGYLWDLMNPCSADYPDYEFEETIGKNFEKAGLFLEPYASWRFDITEAAQKIMKGNNNKAPILTIKQLYAISDAIANNPGCKKHGAYWRIRQMIRHRETENHIKWFKRQEGK